MAPTDLVMSEELICDDCWEPLDELGLWIADEDSPENILCSKCEEEHQWQ